MSKEQIYFPDCSLIRESQTTEKLAFHVIMQNNGWFILFILLPFPVVHLIVQQRFNSKHQTLFRTLESRTI